MKAKLVINLNSAIFIVLANKNIHKTENLKLDEKNLVTEQKPEL